MALPVQLTRAIPHILEGAPRLPSAGGRLGIGGLALPPRPAGPAPLALPAPIKAPQAVAPPVTGVELPGQVTGIPRPAQYSLGDGPLPMRGTVQAPRRTVAWDAQQGKWSYGQAGSQGASQVSEQAIRQAPQFPPEGELERYQATIRANAGKRKYDLQESQLTQAIAQDARRAQLASAARKGAWVGAAGLGLGGGELAHGVIDPMDSAQAADQMQARLDAQKAQMAASQPPIDWNQAFTNMQARRGDPELAPATSP